MTFRLVQQVWDRVDGCYLATNIDEIEEESILDVIDRVGDDYDVVDIVVKKEHLTNKE